MNLFTARRENLLKVTFITLAALFLLTPSLNKFFHLLPETEPRGVRVSKTPTALTWNSFVSGEWQRDTQTRVRILSPLTLPFINIGRELYLSLFGQTASYTSDFPIALGKEGHLFRTKKLPALNRTQPVDSAVIREKMTKLKLLQDHINARGGKLVFLITPTFTSIYPELVPGGFLVSDASKRPSLYSSVTTSIKELNITAVDAHSLLTSIKTNYPFRFFARSASHWNDVGSCLTLAAVNHILSSVGHGLRRFDCSKWEFAFPPRAKDRDLTTELSLAFPERFFEPTPYVTPSFIESEIAVAKRPRVFAVGTSFLAALMEHLLRWELADNTLMYLYYRRQKERGWEKFHSLDKTRIDWSRVLSSEIIIVSAGMGELEDVGYGFIEDALANGTRLGWW